MPQATIWNPNTAEKKVIDVGAAIPTGFKLWTGGTATGVQAQQAIIKAAPVLPTTNNISSSDISNGMNMSGVTPPPKTADLIHETFANNAQQYSPQQKDMFGILDQQRTDAQGKIDELNTKQTDIQTGKAQNLDDYSSLMIAKPGMTADEITRQTQVNDIIKNGTANPQDILNELNSGKWGNTNRDFTIDEINKLRNEYYNPTGFRQAMETAGNTKYQLDQKYQDYTTNTNEINTLSNMYANELAKPQTPGIASVMQGRADNTKAEYAGRISVLQAANASIDGNITLARTFIDRGIEAVNADRNDRINFLNFYNGLLDQKDSDNKTALLTATADEKKAITDEIGMLQGKITETENNKKFVQTLFTDTQTSQVAIKAGVSLTDTSDQAVKKIAEYTAANPDLSGNYEVIKDALGNVSAIFNKKSGQMIDQNGVNNNNNPSSVSTLDQPSVNKFLSDKSPTQIAAFNAMDDVKKSDVMQLVNGDVLLNDLMTSRGVAGSAAKQQLLMEARQVDPTFSENSNKQKYAFQVKWNDPNGKAYLARNSMNTAMEHLAELKGVVDKMENSGIQATNKISNIVKNETGNPNVTDFNYITGVLAAEIASAYKGGSATDQEIETERNNIANYFSGSQLNGVITTAVNLLAGKLASTGDEYKNVMGKFTENLLVHPSTLDNIEKVGIDDTKLKQALIPQGLKLKTLGDYIYYFPGQVNTAIQIKTENPAFSDEDILQILQPDFTNVGGDTEKATLNKVSVKEDGTNGGQCGSFVNKLTGLGVGDTYQSKIAKMDSSIEYPAPGMVFTMPYKDTGHVGFILSINNGIATVKDSNFSLDGKIKTHQIPVSKMTGFAYA